MALQDQLDAYKAEFVTRVPESKQAIMRQATESLRNSGILERTIKLGDKLPAFNLANQDGAVVASDDLLAQGPLVISFFRGVWCPYCNIELQALEQWADAFRQAGAQLVTIAPQQAASARKTKTNNTLSFDVLIDEGNAYARTLGLAFSLPDDLREVYRSFGIVLPEHNGDESWTLPMPARLVVDRTGRIIYADISPDYTVRPDPSETVAAVKQLKAAA